jgi:scyllo-inositol 2-dehydrogenase (NADP+)
VFHNRRWDSDFLTLRDVLPRLGEIMLFEAHWDRFRPQIKQGWREQAEPGAGLWNDLGPHMIDQVLQLFGMPAAVDADILAQRAEAIVDDYFDVTLLYEKRRVRLRSSTLIAAPRPRFAVHGTKGSFIKSGLDPQEAQLKTGIDPRYPSFGIDSIDGVLVAPDGERETIPSRRGDYPAFYDSIAAAIVEGTSVPVTAHEARDGLTILSLARQASKNGAMLPVPDANLRATSIRAG